MKKKQVFKRLLAGVLAAAVTVSAVVVPTSADEGIKLNLTEVSSEGFLTRPTGDKLNEVENSNYADTDVVRVSIFLDDASTIKAGFDIDTIATNSKAIAYRDNLKVKQELVEEKIEKATSEELEVVHNLTLAANVISANVKFGQIKAIEKISGVKSVVIENQYEAAKSVANLADDPNMSTSTNQIGSNVVWAEGYTGAGSKVAVIDTGIDTTHQSFDEGAYLYSLSLIAEEKGMTLDEYKATLNLLDAAYIEKVADQLNVKIDADKVNVSEKIPFAYNYVDLNYDVTHANDTQGEHGSHVEGIAAANKYIKDNDGKYVTAIDTVKVQGVAPDAQIITMKVFGTKGGAYDSDYMLAIEDAIVLGADAINLSLGSGMGGNSKHATAAYQQIFEDLSKSGAVVSISAGNAGHWADSASTGGYLYADDVNTQTDGSPGSYTNAFTVASADNIGFTGEYFTIADHNVFYTQTDYTNKPLSSLAGEQEYIYLDAVWGTDEDGNPAVIAGGGTAEEWAAIGDAVKGKIAVVSRGAVSFYQKGEFAVAAGAIGVIVYNNEAGSINMNLSGYTKTAPVVSITQAEGAYFKENGTLSADGKYYTGTIDISTQIGTTIVNTGFSTISSFSSWGVPGSLELKPEITAPGGNIYSVHGYAWDSQNKVYAGGNDSYENMSGTSMAAPQVAGMSALAAQYIRENGLEEKTGLKARTLAQSLLMSTAVPMMEDLGEFGVYYYPILRQGAGLANIGNVVKAESYILMDKDANAGAADGKVKVELGDDPDKKGVYTFGFTLYNLTDVAKAYTLSADMFTQYVFADNDNNLYMDTSTEDLSAKAEFDCGQVAFVPANGEVHVTATITLTDEDKEYLALSESGAYIEGYVFAVPYMMYDFDGDGDVDTDDGQRLLDYRTGVETELYNKEYADIDGDGDIDTYDAYLFLNLLETGKLQIVEGEGIVGTTHSIPVFGFYGNWSTASMFDKGSYVEYELAKTEDRDPYLAVETGNDDDARDINAFGVTYPDENRPYVLGGNIMLKDLTYHPERVAVNNINGTYLSLVQFAAIRNAVDSKFTVVNETTGETVLETSLGAVTAAYYYANGGQWRNTASSFKPNYDFSGAKENDKLSISFALAPEYYQDAEGNVRWEDVDMTNALSTSVTIDNTAPKIESAVLNGNTLTVTAADNQYISTIALVNKGNTKTYAYCGSSETQKAGEAAKFELDVTGVNADQLYLQVYDYALNATTYAVPEKFGEGTVIPSALAFDAFSGEWVTYDKATDTIEYLEGSNYSFTAAAVVDHIVYAVDENGVLYTMPEKDLSDTTRVISLNIFFGEEITVFDMAYDKTTETLFALINGNYLAPINLLTGEVENLFRTPFATTTLAIDDEGNFYSNRVYTGEIYRYNLRGDFELIAEFEDSDYMGLPYLQGMEYDPVSGTVDWAWVDVFSFLGLEIPITTYVEIDLNAETPEEACTVYEDHFGYQLTSLIFTDKTTESETPDWAKPTNTVEEVYIDILNPYVTMLKNNTLQLTADVAPWTAADRTVTWVSLDESIATVDQNGKVTAVGVGTTLIGAISNADEDVLSAIQVTVEPLDITVNGVLQDVGGEPLIYKWDMSEDIWEKLADIDCTVESVTVNGKNGHLYVMDANDGVYSIHEIDPEDGTEINVYTNDLGLPFVDIAYSDKFSTEDSNKISGIYYYYFCPVQDVAAMSGSAFNLANNSHFADFAVAIANLGEEKVSYSGQVYDTEKYAILDNAGTLLVYYVYDNGNGGYGALTSSYSTGIKETYPGFDDYDLTASMVVGEDGKLYVSAFNGESNNIYQIALDEDEGTCTTNFVANAGDGVWPVAISSVTVNAGASGSSAANGTTSTEVSENKKFDVEESLAIEKFQSASDKLELVTADVEKIDPSAIVKPERATLVDAAEDVATEPSEEGKGDTSATVDGDKLTVTIVPKDEDGKNVDTTNGLFRVTYDTDKLTLVSTDVNADYESVNDAAEGKVVIGYVNPAEALAAGDKAVELVFTVKEGAELDSSSLVVDHAEVIDTNYDKFEDNGDVAEEGEFLEEKPLADPEKPDVPTEPTPTEPDDNKPTGIAIALVPALVSAAAVMITKKRRNRK